jgi:hypothetical protein
VPRVPLTVSVAVVVVAVLGACDPGSRQDRFCARLAKERIELSVVPTDPGDLDDFVQRYRELGKVAPLAIDDQWQTVTDLMVAVVNDDLSDPQAADRLRDRAVAATKAVNEVKLYAQQTCRVNLNLAVSALPAGTTPGPTAPPTTAPATLPPTVP